MLYYFNNTDKQFSNTIHFSFTKQSILFGLSCLKHYHTQFCGKYCRNSVLLSFFTAKTNILCLIVAVYLKYQTRLVSRTCCALKPQRRCNSTCLIAACIVFANCKNVQLSLHKPQSTIERP